MLGSLELFNDLGHGFAGLRVWAGNSVSAEVSGNKLEDFEKALLDRVIFQAEPSALLGHFLEGDRISKKSFYRLKEGFRPVGVVGKIMFARLQVGQGIFRSGIVLNHASPHRQVFKEGGGVPRAVGGKVQKPLESIPFTDRLLDGQIRLIGLPPGKPRPSPQGLEQPGTHTVFALGVPGGQFSRPENLRLLCWVGLFRSERVMVNVLMDEKRHGARRPDHRLGRPVKKRGELAKGGGQPRFLGAPGKRRILHSLRGNPDPQTAGVL